MRTLTVGLAVLIFSLVSFPASASKIICVAPKTAKPSPIVSLSIDEAQRTAVLLIAEPGDSMVRQTGHVVWDNFITPGPGSLYYLKFNQNDPTLAFNDSEFRVYFWPEKPQNNRIEYVAFFEAYGHRSFTETGSLRYDCTLDN